VQGPKAKEVVHSLFGDRVLQLRYYHFLEAMMDGIPVVVTRTGWSGEVGYEIYLRDGSRGDDLWERIMEAGRPHHIRPTGPSDIRRIEAGILNWGSDMTLENNVYELGLDYLVDDAKTAPYIGRDALKRIRENGIRRELASIEIAGERIEMNAIRWAVTSNGTSLGCVTSAVWSPRLSKNIGYAMLPMAQAAIGTVLDVTIPGADTRKATVVDRPFFDPGKEIPKS
jgi:aminomethyltransferase